jgi:branched-chain amino acid transport system permease protein
MAAAAAAALIIGCLVLRTAGVYFIMVTLAFAQMLYAIFHDTKLGGGSDGITSPCAPSSRSPALDLSISKIRSSFIISCSFF